MSDHFTALTPDERAILVKTLIQIQSQLDQAGEALAAVHISQALECLDPGSPINHQDARQLH
jgi:hypothetical protein